MYPDSHHLFHETSRQTLWIVPWNACDTIAAITVRIIARAVVKKLTLFTKSSRNAQLNSVKTEPHPNQAVTKIIVY